MRYLVLVLCVAVLSTGLACHAGEAGQASNQATEAAATGAAQKPRVILVGGFLGSGKTTLLRQAAKALAQEGKRIGLVTNDQAPMLVDTRYLRDSSLAVKEVAGGCFCCKFSEFADALSQFVRESAPDIVLGEPVGSCTDISATLLQPLKDRYRHRYTLAPFTVLLDPDKASIVLGGGGESKLDPSAKYILRKQAEEADVIALNKIDLLSKDRASSLLAELSKSFPQAKVFAMSALTGQGVNDWLRYVMSSEAAGRNITDVDYDIYARGEAVLGWLNCTAQVKRGSAGDARDLCSQLMNRLQSSLAAAHAEIAHLKMILESSDGRIVKASLTSSSGRASVEGSAWAVHAPATLTLNARVQIDPRELERIAREALSAVAGGGLEIVELKCFSPARPKPTFRYDKTVGG